MGDSRYKDQIDAKNFPGQGGDSSQRLHDAAYKQPDGKGTDKVTDKAEGATVSGGKGKADNPYDHLSSASDAVKQLSDLAAKKPDEKVHVDLGGGKFRDCTVAERRQELEKVADTEYKAAIKAADGFDQKKVTSTVFELNNKEIELNRKLQSGTLTDDQKQKAEADLKQVQHEHEVVQAIRQGPAVDRFGYAQFLAEDKGDLTGSRKLMDKVLSDNPEAQHEPQVQEFSKRLDQALKQVPKAAGGDPFESIASADQKIAKGDSAGADADFRKAIDQAHSMPKDALAAQLAEVQKAKAQEKDPEKLKDLETKEKGLNLLTHAESVARMNYADFLNQQKRYDDAAKTLDPVAKNDADFAKSQPDYALLVQAAKNHGQAPEQKPFDDPYAHYTKFQDAYKSGHLDVAETELKNAVKAADALPKDFQQKIADIDKQLATTKDEGERKKLTDLRSACDQAQHASAFLRLQLGRFELANKQYASAKSLFQDVQKMDPEYAGRPTTQMKELLEASQEPSTLSKVMGTALNIGKELLCDGVSVLAGVGTAVLTGWSGPGAVIAGGVVGSATYLAMRGLVFGEVPGYNEGLKDTAIHAGWGFVNGATGGLGGITKAALVDTAAGLATKEIAETAIIKTAGSSLATRVAELQGAELISGGARGMKYFGTAETLAKEGLGQMAKEAGLLTRLKTAIPFANTGSAELREAKAAYRALAWRNTVTRAYINAGTAASMSLAYRGAHETEKYVSGEYKSFGQYAENLATKVALDTTTGVGFGAIGTSSSGSMGFDFLSSKGTGLVAASPYLQQLLSDPLPTYTAAAVEKGRLETPVKNYDEWMDRYGDAPGSETYVEAPAPVKADQQTAAADQSGQNATGPTAEQVEDPDKR